MSDCAASKFEGACCCTCVHMTQLEQWPSLGRIGWACVMFSAAYSEHLTSAMPSPHGMCEMWTPSRGPFLRPRALFRNRAVVA